MADRGPVIHGPVILGAGGHARVVAEAAAILGLSVAGYLAPQAVDPDRAPHPRHLGDDGAIPALLAAGHDFILGTGFVDGAGAARRAALVARIPEDRLARLIHPRAMVSPSARIGRGVFLAVGAILGAGSRVDTGAILNSGAIVDHDCRIGVNSHVATGSRVAGGVTIGRNCLIGAGAVIRQGVIIGDGAVAAAGAAVIADVAPGSIVAGVPARPLAPKDGR